MYTSRKPISITVAVISYFGGEILAKTIDSILSTTPSHVQVNLLVFPNGIQLDDQVRNYLKDRNVTIVFNRVEKGLTYRIKQAINECFHDFLILTQDGIGFTPTTLVQTLQSFRENPDVTITSAKIEPSHAQSLGEAVTEVRSLLKWRIGNHWRRKDNYLMLSSKFMGLRMRFIKNMNIPDAVNNVSTYLYLENKKQNGRFKYVFNAICTNKRPQNIYSYIDWRKSLLSTQDEMAKYFELTGREFKIPKSIVAESIFMEFVNKPVPTMLYFLVLTYIKAKQYFFAADRKVQPVKVATEEWSTLVRSKIKSLTEVPPKRRVRVSRIK